MSQLPSEKEGNEEDYEENDEAVTFRSEELVNFLNCTLKYYRYDSVTEFATCQVADSVKSNIKAARIMNIPHLDCNNHTLNLQVRLMIKEDKPLAKMIANMHEVMVSIKGSLKNSALLRKVTQLRPVIENVTRWTSVFSMMTRTLRIFDHLMDLANDNSNTIVQNEAVTSTTFNRRAQKKTSLMFEINQACLHLQQKYCKRATRRAILDFIIKNARENKTTVASPFYGNNLGTRYIKLGNHLSSSPAFESGVIKIQNGREDDLTPIELTACRPLLKTNQDTEILPRPNTISQIMAGRKRKNTELKSYSKYEA